MQTYRNCPFLLVVLTKLRTKLCQKKQFYFFCRIRTYFSPHSLLLFLVQEPFKIEWQPSDVVRTVITCSFMSSFTALFMALFMVSFLRLMCFVVKIFMPLLVTLSVFALCWLSATLPRWCRFYRVTGRRLFSWTSSLGLITSTTLLRSKEPRNNTRPGF